MLTEKFKYKVVIGFLILFANTIFCQRTDSTLAIGGITGDSVYIIHEHVPKSRLLGNSWYAATSYNLSSANEFDINIGRTYGSSLCGGAGCYYMIRSWGLGYSITANRGETSNMVKAFWEYALFYFPPAGVRAEYIYDITNKTHYLRPSLGLSFFHFDILYNYSFKVSGNQNNFKHGVTFRIKYFHRQKNWQRSFPRRC